LHVRLFAGDFRHDEISSGSRGENATDLFALVVRALVA
jgi:hypothetical protein